MMPHGGIPSILRSICKNGACTDDGQMRKKKMKRINSFDFLYYTIGTEYGVRLMLLPLLWLIPLSCPLIFPLINSSYIGIVPIVLAIGAGLIYYLVRCYFYKREDAIRKHFDKTKYSKSAWKWGIFALWIFLWFVLPLIVIGLCVRG